MKFSNNKTMQSNAAKILQKVESYSPDMQREIFDFIEFIENKYKFKISPNKKKSERRNRLFFYYHKMRITTRM